MPWTVDEDKIKQEPGKPSLASMDPAKPPLKEIPFLDFPRVLYKHPKEPTRKIIHRNAKHEVVEEEIVLTEHLTMSVQNEEELAKAIKQGWVKKPYVPKAEDNPDAHLYESK